MDKMKMDKNTFVRLLMERDELRHRLADLNRFCEGDKYHGLDEDNRDLLKRQLSHMESYLGILTQHIGLNCCLDFIDPSEK